jgi:hypothetical protein
LGAILAAAVVLLLAPVRYFVTPRPWSAGDAWGLAFGGAAAVLMMIAGLYPLRRRLLVRPLKTAQAWLQFHIYGSSLAALLVLAHTGFGLPRGRFGWLLYGLTLWVTVSGLIGVLLQKTLPSLLSRRLQVEAIYERIPGMVEELRARARQLATGASDIVRRFHETEVDPLLASLSPSWAVVLGADIDPVTRSAAFAQVESFVTDASERARIAELKQIVSTKIELDAHYSVQRLLRRWPILHVPAALALLATVIGHIAVVWYF